MFQLLLTLPLLSSFASSPYKFLNRVCEEEQYEQNYQEHCRTPNHRVDDYGRWTRVDIVHYGSIAWWVTTALGNDHRLGCGYCRRRIPLKQVYGHDQDNDRSDSGYDRREDGQCNDYLPEFVSKECMVSRELRTPGEHRLNSQAEHQSNDEEAERPAHQADIPAGSAVSKMAIVRYEG